MTHTYNISGMTCSGCQAKVQALLSGINGISGVKIDLAKGEADITMNRHISTTTLQDALKDYPKYKLSEAFTQQHPVDEEPVNSRTWLQVYKPVLLIFVYVTTVAIITAWQNNTFQWMTAMRIFMAGFFLSFSFFKMLDLKGFADSYATYDIVAKKIKSWGFIYAFVELALGIAYTINFQPLFTAATTFIIMSVSIAGVLQTVLNKKKIRCACLGAVFNLPMSTVTIIEDALMIVMSAIMIIQMA